MSPAAHNAFGRLVDWLSACLTPEVAERIVRNPPDAGLRERLGLLREKANEGTLTTEERDEYAEYVEALDLMALFKAKARSVLDERPS